MTPYRSQLRQTILACGLIVILAVGMAWIGYVHREQNTLNAALFYAVASDNPHKVRLLLKEGADPNTKWRDDRSFTLLDYCKQTFGMDPLVSESGHTPLMLAAADGKLSLSKALIEADGVNLDLRDGEGYTAVHWAARCHKRDGEAILLLLAKHGANFNAKAADGKTAWDLVGQNPQMLQALRQSTTRK